MHNVCAAFNPVLIYQSYENAMLGVVFNLSSHSFQFKRNNKIQCITIQYIDTFVLHYIRSSVQMKDSRILRNSLSFENVDAVAMYIYTFLAMYISIRSRPPHYWFSINLLLNNRGTFSRPSHQFIVN